MSMDAKWYAEWVRSLPASTADEKMRNLEAADMLEELEQRIRQLEWEKAQLELMNAEQKYVLDVIKHAADMGVHGNADDYARLGINMGRGVEEDE